MSRFFFKQFEVSDDHCGMKVCTDSVLLGAWAECQAEGLCIDLGAGSGLLSLMVAQRCPQARVLALEIDPEACLDAQDNFQSSPWSDRLEAVCCNAMDYEPDAKPSLIICNPPYFNSTLKSPDGQRATARHADTLGPESALALALRWLASDGSLAMVTPADNASGLIFHAEMCKLHLRRQCLVSTIEGKSPARALWQWSRVDGPCVKQSLAIRRRADGGVEYTDEYINLTKYFYLNF